MARATFVKKARKANPAYGIEIGDSYYWWKFRFGSKQCSKNRPARSQLTQSAFLSQFYGIEDRIAMCNSEISDQESFETFKEDITGEIEALREECQDSLDNMPEHLQDTSSSGELLTERIDGLEEWQDQIDGVECECEEEDMKQEAIDEHGEYDEEEWDDLEAYNSVIEDSAKERTDSAIEDAIDELQGMDSGL